jgi:integrase
MAGGAAMSFSSMPERVAAYLRTRRALGFALRIEGEQLERFAAFTEQRGHQGPLTLELAVAWANSSRTPNALGPARRLETLRPFAKYCRLFEPQTPLLPARLFGPAHRRLTPHIYTEQELADLFAASAELAPTDGLRPVTMRILLGLLAASGLRVGEALRLTDADLDRDPWLLRIRQSKFRRSRLVPIATSTGEALAEYTRVRNACLKPRHAQTLFAFDNGRPLTLAQADYAFKVLRTRLGWDRDVNGRWPRLYDLRHTFACRRLLAWYAQGVDINRRLVHLATYLGHVKVSDTYWYLTGIPALMAIAAARFEQTSVKNAGARPCA